MATGLAIVKEREAGKKPTPRRERIALIETTHKITDSSERRRPVDEPSESAKRGHPSLNCREIGSSCGLHSVSNIWSDSIAVASAMMFA